VPNSISKVLEAAAMIQDVQIVEGLVAAARLAWK
jgi:hypothetical protein